MVKHCLGNSQINCRYQSRQFSFITFLERWRSAWLCERIIFIHSVKLFSTLKKLTFSLSSGHKTTCKSPDLIPCLIPCHGCQTSSRDSRQTHHFYQATWQHPRESHRHVRGYMIYSKSRKNVPCLRCALILRLTVSIPDYGSWCRAFSRPSEFLEISLFTQLFTTFLP